jgi:PAS domain S-box-containing protein
MPSLTPAAIVALYATVAMLYIALSDRMLGEMASTPDPVTWLHTLKGAAFVVLTAAMLYALIKSSMAQITRAQAAEREQHALLRAVVQNTADALSIKDPEGRYLLVNDQVERLIGRTKTEIIGSSDADLFPESLVGRLREAGRSAIESRQPRTIEIELERAGSRFWLLTFSAYRLDDDSVAGIVCVARDVTDQREAEEETRASEARLRMFVQQVPAIIWSVDPELRITSLQGAGLESLGVKPDEHVGSTVAELGIDDGWPLNDVAAHQRALKGESVVFETTRNGNTFECHLEPHRAPDDQIAGAIGLATDVSERARAGQLLGEQEALLRQAQKMEAVGRLAGGLAHDFNNLLTIITSSAEFLEASLGKDDERRDDLLEIRRAGDRAADLVRELLAFSSQQMLQPAVIDLHELLLEARPLLARTLTAHIKLRITSRPGECIVRTDRRQLELVLINLAVNARDAMPHGGTVSVEVTGVTLEGRRMLVDSGQEVGAGSYALLRMRDTGHGMNAETRARIFEPFFSTKTSVPGSGLGLAVVYGVTTQSGGFIEVDSQPGRGTEFRIYLPLAERPDMHPRTRGEPLPVHPTTVLLAEDEDAVRRLARRILEREGYTVLEARDGEEALELISTPGRHVDLVLSDVVMPRLGGRELVERCQVLFPRCRALLMSGYTNDELVRRDVLDSRAVFLPKPFTPDALVSKVREAMAAPVAG